MSDATEFETTVRAFEAAAEWLEATVQELSGSSTSLETTALGVWNVRDLVGHTARALTTVAAYLQPGSSTSVSTTADYYERVRSGRADPDEVAERGRKAGRDLGEDLPAAVAKVVAESVEAVTRRSADACVDTPVGEWTLGEYLPTRVFELTVHTADLRRAAELPGDAPAEANRVALHVVGLLIARAPDTAAGAILAALTGRGALPSGFSLL